jgi:AcrR family transcriptional regulator
VMDVLSTRDRLLEVAAAVFLEHGYSGTSLDQVRRVAGVSNGSLYHHFPTKARLADALYVDILDDFHGDLLAAIRGEPAAELGVKRLVRAYIAWVVKKPDRATLLHRLRREGEVTDASEGVDGANAKTYAALKAWTALQVAQGRMREVPFHLWMALVFAPSFSLTGRWVQQERANVPAKTRTALEHAAWMAVAPTPPQDTP